MLNDEIDAALNDAETFLRETRRRDADREAERLVPHTAAAVMPERVAAWMDPNNSAGDRPATIRELMTAVETIGRSVAEMKPGHKASVERPKPTVHNGNMGLQEAFDEGWFAVKGYIDNALGEFEKTLDDERTRPLTQNDAMRLVRAIAPAIKELIGEAVAPFRERLKAIEERPVMTYRGTWATGMRAMPGEFYTHAGSVWHCHEPTHEPPPGNAWQLAAKGAQR